MKKLLLLGLVVFSSCRIIFLKNVGKQFDIIENCRSNWSYMSLTEELKIEVLYFQPQNYMDISSFPAFVIGVIDKDTLGFIDLDFEGNLNKNDSLLVLADTLPNDIEINIEPLFQANMKDKEENKLQCSINIVYYCKFSPLQ